MDPSTDLSVTCHARGRRLLNAFPTVNTIQEAIDLVFSNECIDACMRYCEHGGTRCPHPKAQFQSTRNSIRSAHAYLFLLAMTGSPAAITDFMVKAVRGNLTPTCAYGVRLYPFESLCSNFLCSAYNGHRISTDPNHRQVCINPFHYKVRNVRAVIQLFIDADLLPKTLVTHVSNAPAGVVVATIHDAILNGTIHAPSIRPYKKSRPAPCHTFLPAAEIDAAISMCAMRHSCPAPAPLSPTPS
jgi:hypothetical protein